MGIKTVKRYVLHHESQHILLICDVYRAIHRATNGNSKSNKPTTCSKFKSAETSAVSVT